MSKIIVRNSITRHLRAALLSSALLLATGGLAAADGNIYRVGANDVLQVTVYGQPALTGLYPVDVDGNIGYPVVGNISVQGLTTLQISEKIASSLSQHIPGLTVTATINQYAPVFVMGDVKAPGKYEFRPGMVALELMALGGGAGKGEA
ncbi:polysaccharide biosynthesis/export family protein, partial [Brucella abortus]